jgi:hypothetical protein
LSPAERAAMIALLKGNGVMKAGGHLWPVT